MAEKKCTAGLRITLIDQVAILHLPCNREVLIDVQDLPLITGRAWYSHLRCKTHYARSPGEPGEGRWMRMHHLILGKPEVHGMVIDHINRNGLDNRRINLRVVPYSVNVKNRGPLSLQVGPRNMQGVAYGHGLTKDSPRLRWKGGITVQGKRIYSKWCHSPDEARKAQEVLVRQHCPERLRYYGFL